MKKAIVFLFMTALLASSFQSIELYATEKVALVGIESTGHDHTSFYSDISGYLNTMGYNNSDIQQGTNMTRNTFLNIMDEREIIVIRSHGNRYLDNSGNVIGTYMSLNSGGIYNSDFEDLDDNLTNAKLFVFCGCYTAAGGVWDTTMRNIVVQSNLKGVRVAVGFSDTIYCDGANTWTKWFFKYLADGENIDTAANNAVSETESHHWIMNLLGELNIDSMLYRGEWNMTF